MMKILGRIPSELVNRQCLPLPMVSLGRKHASWWRNHRGPSNINLKIDMYHCKLSLYFTMTLLHFLK